MFSLSRRINRVTYAAGVILVPLLILALQIILGTVLSLIPGLQDSLEKSKPDNLINVTGVITMIIYFPLLLCIGLYLLILIKQRANDVNEHGLLVGLIALLTIVGILVLALIPGQKGQNKYGVIPRPGLNLRPKIKPGL
jgi:uncharacterized membrane protein YhaH (DUF805 family)